LVVNLVDGLSRNTDEFVHLRWHDAQRRREAEYIVLAGSVDD